MAKSSDTTEPDAASGTDFFTPSTDVAKKVLAGQTSAFARRSTPARLDRTKHDISIHLLRFLGTLARRRRSTGKSLVVAVRDQSSVSFTPEVAEGLRERLGVRGNRALGALAHELCRWLESRSNRYEASWAAIDLTGTRVELTPTPSETVPPPTITPAILVKRTQIKRTRTKTADPVAVGQSAWSRDLEKSKA